ncbi:MAG: SoxR reducing system RseC family protein [Treponemataceae bacterium]
MSEKVQIIKIEKKKILVRPLITDACLSCTDSSCAKQGKPFFVKNILNLPIQYGDMVDLASSPTIKIFQATISLFFPIIMALIGYFASKIVYEKLYPTQLVPEVWRVSGVLLFFIFALTLVFVRSYFFSTPEKAYISCIIEKTNKNQKLPN